MPPRRRSTGSQTSRYRIGSPNYRPCEHVLDYRAKQGPVSDCRLWMKTVSDTWRPDLTCSQCGRPGFDVNRLYACLVCSAIGCWTDFGNPNAMAHVVQHALDMPGHALAVDLDRYELFCCICKDQVYDPEFDKALEVMVLVLQRNGAKHYRKSLIKQKYEPKCLLQFSAKRQFEHFHVRHDVGPRGLRGLNNLGNTCFMNSILQVLLHTRPLQNFFLGDQHNRTSCMAVNGRGPCLGCQMDIVFSATFSGDCSPYSPAKFLYSWWQCAENLFGYKQQDAHEFFISAVDGIHANLATKRSAVDGGDCKCITHETFLGVLRSDVTCTVCGLNSTKYDPCIDISLELGTDQFIGPVLGNLSACNVDTLYGCLDHFTRLEKLDSDQKFYCENCKMPQESFKQISMHELPVVLCFHIKRFEHSYTSNLSHKIDHYIKFPLSLNMMPYVSTSIRSSDMSLCSSNFGVCTPKTTAGYKLYAIVTHKGKMESGHYITYLHLSGTWYICDDSWVCKVTEDEVKACQAYMLYYIVDVHDCGGYTTDHRNHPKKGTC